MKAMVSQDLYLTYPTDKILQSIAPQPFNAALSKCWQEFYEEYWVENFPRLLEGFKQMANGLDWRKSLGQMEKLTGRTWSGNILAWHMNLNGSCSGS